jgi:hypothetical protein
MVREGRPGSFQGLDSSCVSLRILLRFRRHPVGWRPLIGGCTPPGCAAALSAHDSSRLQMGGSEDKPRHSPQTGQGLLWCDMDTREIGLAPAIC